MLVTITTSFLCLENYFGAQRNVFLSIHVGDSVQQHIYDKMWLINALLKPSYLSDFTIMMITIIRRGREGDQGS